MYISRIYKGGEVELAAQVILRRLTLLLCGAVYIPGYRPNQSQTQGFAFVVQKKSV